MIAVYLGANSISNFDWTSSTLAPISHAIIAFITGWSSSSAPGVATCGGASLWSPLPSYPSLVTSACGFSTGSVPGCSALQSCQTSGSRANQGATGVRSFQAQGKKVLVSIGGAVGDYTISTAAEAQQLALVMWELYLGGTNPAYAPFRPFGTAVVL